MIYTRHEDSGRLTIRVKQCRACRQRVRTCERIVAGTPRPRKPAPGPPGIK